MKYLILLSVSAFLISSAFASHTQAPPSFPHKDGKAVFVDFDNASYILNFDKQTKRALVESTITFTVSEPGYPIFDLVPEPMDVTLDGRPVRVALTPDPDAQTARA